MRKSRLEPASRDGAAANRTAFAYNIGLRLLGALWPLFFLVLTILGAGLGLLDLAAIPFTWITQGHAALSDSAKLGLQGAAMVATLAASVFLLRRCTRWYRRRANIDEKEEYDPETRIKTTYKYDESLIDIAYTLIELGLALLVAALVAWSMWGGIAAAVSGGLGGTLVAAGIGMLLRAAAPVNTSLCYYPGTPEFSTLAAQYAIGSEERHRIAAELEKIPPDNTDYPMARKMLESCLSGTPLDVGNFGFGLPPGTPLPPGPNESPERIG